jgi:hypothetical protein
MTMSFPRPRRPAIAGASAILLAFLAAACAPAIDGETRPVPAATPATSQAEAADPREGLRAGWMDAEEASWNMSLLATRPRPDGFYRADDIGDMALANSDLAFQENLVIVGNFHGFNVYDVSDPASPTLRTSVVCPGGQGDVSVYGTLVFFSAQETRGRIDCGPEGAAGQVNEERFRGVRIFDISNLDAPRQVAAVQTCRGSHTHTLVEDPNDPSVIYVYNSGTGPVRPAAEMEGCSGLPPEEDPETSLFQIEVIRVPLASPEQARIVSEPRIFADYETGEIAGLWPGGDHGPGTQPSRETNRCHDITSYPAIGLAAGACSGNGILIDISRPDEPVRVDEVTDPSFVFWHSATFNNEGTTVVFTDEWGGGTQPRCRPEDPEDWGANAIFRIEDGEMRFASYYKLPAQQTETENCVAHNGSLVPVPGRDIKVQAWYQGGISVFDFTDPENPFEIAYFDRGPIDANELTLGGYWSAYWYDGYIYGSEIARGLDVLELVPSEHVTANELEAARQAIFENRFGDFNPQHQPRITWPASVAVARAHLDQLSRAGAIDEEEIAEIEAMLAGLDRLDGERRADLLSQVTDALRIEVRHALRGGDGHSREGAPALAALLGAVAGER